MSVFFHRAICLRVRLPCAQPLCLAAYLRHAACVQPKQTRLARHGRRASWNARMRQQLERWESDEESDGSDNEDTEADVLSDKVLLRLMA